MTGVQCGAEQMAVLVSSTVDRAAPDWKSIALNKEADNVTLRILAKTQKAEIASLKKEISEKEQEIRRLTSLCNQQETDLDEMEKQFTDLHPKLEENDRRISHMEFTILNLNTSLHRLKAFTSALLAALVSQVKRGCAVLSPLK